MPNSIEVITGKSTKANPFEYQSKAPKYQGPVPQGTDESTYRNTGVTTTKPKQVYSSRSSGGSGGTTQQGSPLPTPTEEQQAVANMITPNKPTTNKIQYQTPSVSVKNDDTIMTEQTTGQTNKVIESQTPLSIQPTTNIYGTLDKEYKPSFWESTKITWLNLIGKNPNNQGNIFQRWNNPLTWESYGPRKTNLYGAKWRGTEITNGYEPAGYRNLKGIYAGPLAENLELRSPGNPYNIQIRESVANERAIKSQIPKIAAETAVTYGVSKVSSVPNALKIAEKRLGYPKYTTFFLSESKGNINNMAAITYEKRLTSTKKYISLGTSNVKLKQYDKVFTFKTDSKIITRLYNKETKTPVNRFLDVQMGGGRNVDSIKSGNIFGGYGGTQKLRGLKGIEKEGEIKNYAFGGVSIKNGENKFNTLGRSIPVKEGGLLDYGRGTLFGKSKINIQKEDAGYTIFKGGGKIQQSNNKLLFDELKQKGFMSSSQQSVRLMSENNQIVKPNIFKNKILVSKVDTDKSTPQYKININSKSNLVFEESNILKKDSQKSIGVATIGKQKLFNRQENIIKSPVNLGAGSFKVELVVLSKQTTTNIVKPIKVRPNITSSTFNPLTYNPNIIGFKLPSFSFDDNGLGWKGFKSKDKREYVPDYKSIIFNIHGKVPNKITTGAESRPIPKGFSFEKIKFKNIGIFK